MTAPRTLTWPRDGACLAARNARTNRLLAGRARVAATRKARRIGLLGHGGLSPGQGLWIVPSRGVHTCGMRFAIDLVALDDCGRVVDLVPSFGPWRVRLPRDRCLGVLELPPGTIALSGTRLGDPIVFEKVQDESDATGGCAA